MPDATLHDNRKRIMRLLDKVQARDEVIAGLCRQKLNLLQLYREQHEEVLRLRALVRRNGADMSAVPDPYTPNYDFSDIAAANPSYAMPGTQLDVEFNEISGVIANTQSRLSEIQRDDGAIRNGVVGLDAMSEEARSLFATPSLWTTATAYTVGMIVIKDGAIYLCLEAHTSGTFATDLSADKWEALGNLGTMLAGSVVQSVRTGTGTTTTCATAIPIVGNRPVKTDGDEVLTLAITPVYDSSYIRATFSCEGLMTAIAADGLRVVSSAIFQGTTTDSFCAGYQNAKNYSQSTAENLYFQFVIQGVDVAAHTGAVTYKVRCGPNTGSVDIGGQITHNGALNGNANTWLLLEEIKV